MLKQCWQFKSSLAEDKDVSILDMRFEGISRHDKYAMKYNICIVGFHCYHNNGLVQETWNSSVLATGFHFFFALSHRYAVLDYTCNVVKLTPI